MTFTVDNLVQDNTIKVILKSDPALDVTDEEFKEYSKTLDESKLKLLDGEQPTRWVMTTHYKKYAHKQFVDAAKIKVDKSGEMSMLIFEYMTREVRCTLTGIESPDSVPPEKRLESKIKFQGDGVLTEDFSLKLGGLVIELFNVRQAYIEAQKDGQASLKKRSRPSLNSLSPTMEV